MDRVNSLLVWFGLVWFGLSAQGIPSSRTCMMEGPFNQRPMTKAKAGSIETGQQVDFVLVCSVILCHGDEMTVGKLIFWRRDGNDEFKLVFVLLRNMVKYFKTAVF